jgi:hypothetical protein
MLCHSHNVTSSFGWESNCREAATSLRQFARFNASNIGAPPQRKGRARRFAQDVAMKRSGPRAKCLTRQSCTGSHEPLRKFLSNIYRQRWVSLDMQPQDFCGGMTPSLLSCRFVYRGLAWHMPPIHVSSISAPSAGVPPKVIDLAAQLQPIGVAFVLGFAPALIARWKRRRMTPWYLYGLVCALL